MGKYIDVVGLSMIIQLNAINKMELYGRKEYNFLYGMNEKHASYKRMFKEIKRVLWRKR